MAYSMPHLFDSVLMGLVSSASQSDPTLDAVFGKDGGSLRSLLAEYDYDQDHAWLNRNINQDSLHLFGACWIAFAVHYGDIETALQQFDQSLEVARRSTEEADVVLEAIGLTMGLPMLVHMAFACDLPKDRRQALHGLLIAANVTWDTAERKADEAAEAFPWFRPRGNRERNAGPLLTAESVCWNTKCAWVLSSNSSGSQQSAEVLASLPSVDEIIDSAMVFDHISGLGLWSMMNSFVYMAQVCEHLADVEKALNYASAALETDLTKAGTHNPSDRIIACLILGRAHVALGHIAKGAAAFESAATQAHRYGYYLWECFALRDLKSLILDQKLGHSNDSDIVHGSRRSSRRSLTAMPITHRHRHCRRYRCGQILHQQLIRVQR